MSDVFCRIEGVAGRITLDRPAALNALTLSMIETMLAALDGWSRNAAVQLVILDGAGSGGLCAGGDLRAMHAALLGGDIDLVERIFTAEYSLNARIARYAKPYVALMDGIVMGGGVGISAYGSHRLVTERSAIAMPETGIGLVPDVGTTWLLGRIPNHLGMHAAMTGQRFGAADAIRLGLADHCVPAAALPGLIEALAHGAPLDATIRNAAVLPPPGTLPDAETWIAKAYATPTVETILATLRAMPEPEAQEAAAQIATRSPTMLKVTHRALREGASGTLEQALAREYTIVRHCFRGAEFIEGIRAAVIDKNAPHWQPSRLQDVSQADVDRYFTDV